MINDKTIEKYLKAENDDWREGLLVLDIASAKKYYKERILTAEDFVVEGPVVGNYTEGKKRKIVFAPPAHTLCIGGTGAGKSQCYYSTMMECLSRSKDNPSMFVMDLKGEFYRRFAPWLKEQGYKVYVWDAKEPMCSDRYNPLSTAWDCYHSAAQAEKLLDNATGEEREYEGVAYASFEDWQKVVRFARLRDLEESQSLCRRIARIIVPVKGTEKDPSWTQGAQNMLYLIFLGMLEDSLVPGRFMTKEKFTICNAIRIGLNAKNGGKEIDEWIRIHDTDSEVRGLEKFYLSNAKVTRDGYEGVLASSVTKWRSISTELLTSYSDIDVSQIVDKLDEEKVVIFCITDETRSESYDLCAMFLDNIVSTIKRRTDTKKPLARPFHFLFDEFGNMPCIQDMDSWISTLRSYNVWLHLGIQSFSQLEDNYQGAVAETIKDNCSVKLFFGCNNASTVDAFINSVGASQVMKVSYSINNNNTMSKNLSLDKEPLLRKSDLMYLQLGEAVVTSFRLPCLRTVMEPYFAWQDIQHEAAVEDRSLRDYDCESVKYDVAQAISVPTPPKKEKLKKQDFEEGERNPFDDDDEEDSSVEDLFGIDEEDEDDDTDKDILTEKEILSTIDSIWDESNSEPDYWTRDDLKGSLRVERLERIGLFPATVVDQLKGLAKEEVPRTELYLFLKRFSKFSGKKEDCVNRFIRRHVFDDARMMHSVALSEYNRLEFLGVFNACPEFKKLVILALLEIGNMTIDEFRRRKTLLK